MSAAITLLHGPRRKCAYLSELLPDRIIIKDNAVKKNKIYGMAKNKYFVMSGALFLSVGALFFSGCAGADIASKAEQEADFFAYTDSENRLYLWKEGSADPVFLTDGAFDVQEETAEIPYWEAWEYWQEWDEANGRWVQNEEKALCDVVWEAPDQSLFFPKGMGWKEFGMQRSAKELEEARAYAAEEEPEEWVKVRAFCYDLYQKGVDAGQEAEKLAADVLFYSVDESGAVWYCRALTDGTVQAGEEELPCARCMLYRYDETEHQEIGEIDGRRKEPYRVGKNGAFAAYYGMDGSLYGYSPGEEPMLLAEGVDAVLGRDDEEKTLLYTRDGSVYAIREQRAETCVYAGEEDRQSVGALGKEGNLIFVLEAREDNRYSDWIAREDGEEDEDTKKLWELLEEKESDYYPLYCTVRVMDISVSPAEIMDEVEGYVLSGPVADEEGNPKDVYYMEMMPADSFEKIPLSELLGDSLPGDVLYSYEYYLGNYGEAWEEQAFAWGLEACWEREAFEKRASLYAVSRTGIHMLDGLKDGVVLGTDYSSDGETLYLTQYGSPEMERDYRRYGHHLYYGYLENRYALDGDGNCRKVVELADETAVVNDEVFYSRNMGLEGYVSLYGAGHEDALASAADISLESLKGSRDTDAYLFLAEGLMTGGKEEIPVYARADLRAAYRELGIERERFSDEKNLHTLILYREGTARELERDVDSYAFYGADSVWMLQYGQGDAEAEDEDREEEKKGRVGSLLIYENGEKRRLTDQAVWVVRAGSRTGSRSASWVFG